MVSIIIPVFNGENFIYDAYRAIISQSLQNFEIIFVDNNSKDGSLQILKEIEKEDSRVLLLTENKQGASSARNKGLSFSKGEFIYFFDVDDELFDEAIKALLKVLLEDDSLDSVHGNTLKSNLRLKDLNFKVNDSNKITIPEPYYWGIRWMHYGKLPGTPSFLHRRRVFEKIGHFNTDLKLGEDAALHVKLGMECKIAHLDKMILLYFRHSKSTVSYKEKVQAKEFTYWEPLIKEHIPYLVSHELPNAYKYEVLRRVYSYIPKMLALTNGYEDRKNLKTKLISDILPLKIPYILRPFNTIIAISGSLNLFKAYYYYLLKFYLRNFLKSDK